MRKLIPIALLLFVTACTSQKSAEADGAAESATAEQTAQTADSDGYKEPAFGEVVEPGSDDVEGTSYKKALFAGGCFWCMEPPFDKVDGVIASVSGYTGGPEDNPKYKQVASGLTGHTEAILVVYDPSKVNYEKLVEVFWKTHDPTDTGGQFVDRGPQYRPGIYPYNEAQKAIATKSRDALEASGRFDKPVALEMKDASKFWPAELYHQDFYKKDPNHYKRYRSGSGRDQFIDRVWNGS